MRWGGWLESQKVEYTQRTVSGWSRVYRHKDELEAWAKSLGKKLEECSLNDAIEHLEEKAGNFPRGSHPRKSRTKQTFENPPAGMGDAARKPSPSPS